MGYNKEEGIIEMVPPKAGSPRGVFPRGGSLTGGSSTGGFPRGSYPEVLCRFQVEIPNDKQYIYKWIFIDIK